MVLAHPVDRRRVDVGDDDVGALVEGVADEVLADLADAGDPDAPAARLSVSQQCAAAASIPW